MTCKQTILGGVLSAAVALLLCGCSDGRNQTGVYLGHNTPGNDQAGKSSLPGAGSNTPSGGAGGNTEGSGTVRTSEAGTGGTAGTGVTGSGTGKGTGLGAMAGTPVRPRQKQ